MFGGWLLAHPPPVHGWGMGQGVKRRRAGRAWGMDRKGGRWLIHPPPLLDWGLEVSEVVVQGNGVASLAYGAVEVGPGHATRPGGGLQGREVYTGRPLLGLALALGLTGLPSRVT
jgi:hypothetical protein